MIKISVIIRSITVLVLLLTGAMLMMIGVASNTYASASGFQWRHFGAAPFAKTRVVAMQKRHSAFLAFGIPAGAVRLLMKATEKPGTPTTLVVGQKLDAMISKGGKVHRNVTIAFDSPSVPNMQYAAPAQMWSVTWKGKVYTVYLPEICHNWSIVMTPEVVTIPPECASVTFRVKHPGDQVRFAVFTYGERLPSDCWSLSDGNVVSAAPSPCSVCNWEGPLSVLPTGLKVEYSGLYVAHSLTQTLRFPREVKGFYIALCITSVGLGESDSWIISPHAWKGTYEVHIPYAKWPVWGPAAITYGRH